MQSLYIDWESCLCELNCKPLQKLWTQIWTRTKTAHTVLWLLTCTDYLLTQSQAIIGIIFFNQSHPLPCLPVSRTDDFPPSKWFKTCSMPFRNSSIFWKHFLFSNMLVSTLPVITPPHHFTNRWVKSVQ